MKSRLRDRLKTPKSDQLASLLCLTICFAVGMSGGCLFAAALGEDVQLHLLRYFDSYFVLAQNSTAASPSLLATIWELTRWPLLAFALGFTVLGVVGLPIVFCVRGFLLSYAVAVLVRLYGGVGLLAALAVFGISGFFALPALFMLGVDAFHSATALAGKLLRDGGYSAPLQNGRFFRAGICCALLALGTALQFWLTPVLLKAVAKLLA